MTKKSLVLIVIILLLAAWAGILVYVNSKGRSASEQTAERPAIETTEKSMTLKNAGRLLAQGDTDAAIKELQVIITKGADSPQTEPAYLLLGAAYEKNGDLLKARDVYRSTMEKFPTANDIARIQEAIDSLNVKILFSRIITEDSFLYEVQKGDSLSKIANKFGATIELLSISNDIKDGVIRFGQKLKIPKAQFSIIVDKSQNILMLKINNDIMKTYRVSTGKNSSTPVGSFKIINKIMNPTWYTAGTVISPDDPNNILGSRWLGISKKGYGIHGTTDPGSIGRSVTSGCVRMVNSDVEELYIMVPAGAEVIVTD